MMNRRRALIAAQVAELDTTPIIMEYNKQWSNGNLSAYSGGCVTQKYKVPWTINMLYKVKTNNAGITLQITAWTGTITNYSTSWSRGTGDIRVNYTFANCWLSCTLKTSDIDDTYLYESTTGIVIFAGRNTAYYGKRNIND